MTPQQLRAIIESDPETKSLRDKGDDFACAERVNAIAPTVRSPILAIEAKRAAALSGAWASLVLVSRESSAAPNQIKGLAITFIDWVNTAANVGGYIDLDLPQIAPMSSALIAAGVVTQDQYDALLELGDTPQVVTALEVEFVRTRT